MDLLSVLPLILLLLLILPVVIFLFFFYHKLKTLQTKSPYPPGPLSLPFIGNLHQLHHNAATHIYLWKLSKKHGPLMSMRLGSVPLLVVSSTKIATQVLKTNDLSFCSRPKVLGQYKISYNASDIAFTPYSQSWRELRKICVLHLLSSKQLQSFGPVREEEVFRMIKNLSVFSDKAAVANLSVTVLSLISTMICRMAFGKMSDDVGEESRKRRFDELMIESQAMLGGFFFSDYMPLFGWVDKLSGMIDRLDKVCKDLDEFFEALIDENLVRTRVKSVTNYNPNILDLLIQLKEDESCSIDLTWDNVKATLMDIFVAGTDTGTATIVWTMTALMQNPTAMKKLQKEIRDLVGGKGKVNEDDIPNIPYLKAVIKEALRLYPPAPLLLRQTLEKINIEGYTIPPKTSIFINAWAIARDPEHWENPNEFSPERFLNTDAADVTGQDFRVIPFGSGRRGCPGMAMGLAMVELAVANLVYAFDWELPNGMKKEDIDTQVLPGLTMYKKFPLCLVPKTYNYSP
ncbi:hypothetical protein ACP275_12G165400 [Erythranthe tilingii]